MLSASNLNDMVTFVRIQILDLLRICLRLFVSEAQLTVIIHSPRVDLVRIVEVEGVEAAGEHILGVLCVRLLDLERLFVLVPSLQLPTNFSGVGISPGIHLLALSKGNSMLSTAHNFLDADFGAIVEDVLRDSGRDLHLASRLARDHILIAAPIKHRVYLSVVRNTMAISC